MSIDTKTLADKLKAAPYVSDVSGKSILLTDDNGNPGKCISGNLFPVLRKVNANSESEHFVRFRGLESTLISVRGMNGQRCALVWVSSYNEGQAIRTTARIFFSSSAHYEWYVGESESIATIYLKLLGAASIERVTALSIAGEIPSVEIVSSLPSSVTKLTQV